MPTTFANTINGNEILAKRSQCDYAGNDLQTTYATKAEVTTGLSSKEDSANKAQTLDPSSSTDFPSSAATANYVNSSVATATANFLGNFTLAELGLTYPATDAQIGAALDAHTWPAGVTPTNNDYTYVEIENPQTTGIDDSVERFKFNGTNWVYEYTLNNSSFTAAEKAAIDSGIDSAKVAVYDAHVANSDIHVTLSDKSAWNAKQDAISDLATIRSGAEAGATAVQPGDLATVATTGDYSDLSNKPDLSVYAESADLATVATTGAYSDLSGTPTIPTATSDLTNDSGFITLSDVPAQVNSDWNSSSGASEILNKPTVKPLVAGSNITITENANDITIAATGGGGGGSYTAGTGIDITSDVISVDSTVVAMQTDIPTVPTTDQTYNSASTNPQSGTAVAGALASYTPTASLATVATTGDFADLTSKPTVKPLVAGSNITITENTNDITIAATGGGTTYTAGDGIDITSDVISADVDGTTIGIDPSTKKIKLLSTIPSVDQTYNSASTNAQSGTAVAGAISTKEDAFDVGTGLEMDTSGSTPTLQVEAPVDIVAGPGIAIDNPDGNTLRVSVDQAIETVLWEGDTQPIRTVSSTINLSETVMNFELIRFEGLNSYAGITDALKFANTIPANSEMCFGNNLTISNGTVIVEAAYATVSGSSLTLIGAGRGQSNSSGQMSFRTDRGPTLYKVVGIHRIANN